MLTAGLRNTFPPSLIRVVITLDPSLKKKEAAITDPTQIIIFPDSSKIILILFVRESSISMTCCTFSSIDVSESTTAFTIAS